jgi:hypothetical protein
MAKKKVEAAEIIIKTTDGGSFKIFGQKAKKTAKEVDNVGRSAQNTDRNIKGLTQQSSNSTKEFSKMATMQGGLVAVYATLAAQVFAVSAAFQFLKSSMEMRNLIEGQMAFGSVTGVAYKTLTADIQAATGGMLQFKEAAQAAAIGTAAGLTAGQMERLGTAAKNTSLALGRDLTDSFNRLVRGVTKAEPELLDELGIVLRLEPAMKAYANQIGKNVKDLTQFEKSQAVANEVLEQAESKFGAITQIMDPSAFALQRFAVAFDELMMKVQKGTANFMIPIMEFASKNVLALVGALTLFLAPILKSILPDFEAMGEAATRNYGAASKAADEAAASAQRAKAALSGAQGDKSGVEALRDTDYMKKHGIKGGKNEVAGQLSARQLEIRKRNLEKGVGFSKNMNKKELAAYKRFLVDQEIALAGSLGKRQGFIKRQQMRAQAMYAQTTAWYKKQQMRMVAITATASKLMNGAMRLMGWAGIILMIVEATRALYNWLVGVDEAAEKEKELAGEITGRYGGLTLELQKMSQVQKLGILDFKGSVEQLGSAFQSTDINKVLGDYAQALTLEDEKKKEEAIGKQVEALRALAAVAGDAEEVLNLATAIENMETGAGFQEVADGAVKFANKMGSAAQASKQFAQTQKAVTASLRGLAGSGAKLAFSSPVENLRKQVLDRKSIEDAAPNALNVAQGNVDAAQTKLDEAVGKRRFTDEQMAEIKKLRSMQNSTGGVDSKALRVLSQQYGLKSLYSINQAIAAHKGQADAVAEAEKNLQSMKETQDGVIASSQANTKAREAEEAQIERMIKLQSRSMQQTYNEIQAKTQAVGVGATKTVADQQAKNELKNKNASLNTSKKQLELDTAIEAARSASEDATEEEKKALAFLIGQKGLELQLAQAKEEFTKKEVERQNKLIEHAQETLELNREIKLAEQARAIAAQENTNQMAVAGTHAEVRLLQQQKITDMEAKSEDMGKRKTLLEQQLKDQQALKLRDTSEEEKIQQQINELTNEELLLEKQITAEKQKQNMEEYVATQRRANDSKRIQLQNMGGGGLTGSFNLNNMTPQGQEFQRLLNENNKTMSDLTEEELTTFKDLANQAADFNTELELANSIQDTMANGFTNMFMAMIDGTQSFGDAMKGVMKQVLADLAAAYVKAAALKALQSFGIPLPGARYGGIMSPSGKSFGYGGIATGPRSGYAAMLHGTEAVVPLGNDRSIPVEMTGGGGGMNTVNVSVNVSGNGQTAMTSNGGGALEGMGRQIGALVQQHLQQEMRPGGILNSQGNRSR